MNKCFSVYCTGAIINPNITDLLYKYTLILTLNYHFFENYKAYMV